MAKMNVTGDYTHVVNLSTKNTELEFNVETPIKFELTFEVTGKNAENFVEEYINVATRNGNDLIVETCFFNISGAGKIVKTTLKNYFTNEYLPELEITNTLNKDTTTFYINQNTEIGTNGLYGGTKDTTENDYILASNDKVAELTFNQGGRDYVVDRKGNDKYDISRDKQGTEFPNIYENAGNDEYFIHNCGYAKIYDAIGNDKYKFIEETRGYVNDIKGNDTYDISGTRGANITDFAGNDKYNLINTQRYENYDLTTIYENTGKDTYTIKNSNAITIYENKGNDNYIIDDINITAREDIKSFVINEFTGNDSYYISNITHNNSTLTDCAYIVEGAGNDKYTLTDVDKLQIDEAKGNDKYTILDNSKNITINEVSGNDKFDLIGAEGNLITEINIADYLGNDNYKLIYSSNITVDDQTGNDKYAMINCSSSTIKDTIGKDNYNLTNGNVLNIEDYANNDKYTLEKCIGTNITDYNGNDNYKISNSESILIVDAIGNDKYNINNGSLIIISDTDGNDTYNIDKLGYRNRVGIVDLSSEKDSLTIKQLKTDNVMFLGYVDADGNTNGDLIIVDTENKGFLAMGRYFNVEDNQFTTIGDGCIETIKAGNTTLNIDESSMSAHLNIISASIASWLTLGAEYDSVIEVLNSGDNNAINELIAYCQ